MGGQIVATNLGGYEYEIKLTAYRDTMGIPMSPTAMFQITMDSAGVITPITTLTVVADSMSGGLVMGVSAAYGVEVYTINKKFIRTYCVSCGCYIMLTCIMLRI